MDFSFVASEGRIHNPYSAVWIEDSAGKLVRTIDLSMENGKGRKYLPDLKRWFSSDQARIASGGFDVAETISGPTRKPGTFKVAWDGRDEQGEFVKQGTYTVNVEAARERGPYLVITEQIAVGASAFYKKLTDNGELQKVTVELRAKA